MADMARNGSPSAGLYLLGAVFLAVAVLAVAGFGGKEDAMLGLSGGMPQGVAVNRPGNDPGQGGSAGRAQVREFWTARSVHAFERR